MQTRLYTRVVGLGLLIGVGGGATLGAVAGIIAAHFFLWLATGAALGFSLAVPVAIAIAILADRRPPGICPHCGYDTTALESDTCPECGKDHTTAPTGRMVIP